MMEKIKEIIKKYSPYSYIVILGLLFVFFKPFLFGKRKTVKRRILPAVKVTRKRAAKKNSSQAKGKKPAWLVKGSPEAKARMAKLRRMRNK